MFKILFDLYLVKYLPHPWLPLAQFFLQFRALKGVGR